MLFAILASGMAAKPFQVEEPRSNWVAVKELSVSRYNEEPRLLCTTYPCYGNLI